MSDTNPMDNASETQIAMSTSTPTLFSMNNQRFCEKSAITTNSIDDTEPIRPKNITPTTDTNSVAGTSD